MKTLTPKKTGTYITEKLSWNILWNMISTPLAVLFFFALTTNQNSVASAFASMCISYIKLCHTLLIGVFVQVRTSWIKPKQLQQKTNGIMHFTA